MEQQWIKFFKNNTLKLKELKKIYGTNSELENYNRTFKQHNNMKPNMIFSLYIDNIKNECIRY